MVVTVKLPAVPTVKVVLLALVMAGAWVAGDRQREGLSGVGAHAVGGGEGQGVDAAAAGGGVPLSVAVPLPLS